MISPDFTGSHQNRQKILNLSDVLANDLTFSVASCPFGETLPSPLYNSFMNVIRYRQCFYHALSLEGKCYAMGQFIPKTDDWAISYVLQSFARLVGKLFKYTIITRLALFPEHRYGASSVILYRCIAAQISNI
ncbi:Uncharacterised protein r2_g490 [Pycnogonum litorale]